MIHTADEFFETRESVAAVSLQPDTAVVTIPDAHLLFTAEFKRKGSDLVLTGDDGHKILVPDYFRHDKQPDLVSPEGALLSASLVELLAGSVAPGQYAQDAQAAAPAAQQPVGRVETVSGSATVTRNGIAVDLNVGDLVFQGDVVQTRSDSTLGIGFADGSAFSLKENARMALNEFVYDPNSTANSALINLVQGTVSFIASQVAKTGNMRVETPTATLGIRGTFVTVDVSSVDGHTVASLGLETNLQTGEQFAGAFTLTNRITGNQVNVNSVNSMFSVSPNGTIGESAKPAAMQAIEQASFQALSAIAAATAASMGTGPTGPTQFLNDPNSPSDTKAGDTGPSSGPAPGGSSGANTPPPTTSPVDNHPTAVTLAPTTAPDTHPDTTTGTTVVQTPPGPLTPPAVQTTSTNTPTVQTTHTTQTTPPPPPPPTITIASMAGANVINNAAAAAGFTISGTESNADGQTVTVKIVDGSGDINGILTTTASAGTWSVNVSPALAQALADGAHTFQATVTDQNGNNSNTASQSVTVHQTLPVITVAQVDGNGIINAANAHIGVTISGTESNADGQTITVKVLDSHNNVVDTLTTVALGGSWSAMLSSAQAQALADGSYTVQATVTDQYGNPSNTASQSVTVEQQPTVTTPTISSNDQAGSSTVREGDVLTASASGLRSDSDNSISYKWYYSTDLTKAIDTGATHAVSEADEGHTIVVVATATNGSNETVTATSAPTASVIDNASLSLSVSVIANGTVQQGQTLVAVPTITDADDANATVTYQWQSSSDGGESWTNVSGAQLGKFNGVVSSFYQLTEGDEGKLFRAAASFVDDTGQTISTTSAPTTTTVADVTPEITIPFSYAVDSLSIIKNGTQIYTNDFSQAPIASPTILSNGSPSPIVFITQGSTWTEVGGKAIASSAGVAVNPNTGGGNSVFDLALLDTNTNPQGTGSGQSNLGLKENAAFTTTATFDLTAPPTGSYGMELTDGTATHGIDQLERLLVTQSGGNTVVELVQANLLASTQTVLASQVLTATQLASNNQIEFQFSHLANFTQVTGAFALGNNGSFDPLTTFSPTATAFTSSVTWTRVDVGAFTGTGVSITGTAKEGQTLTANAATNDAAATITYKWYHSNDLNTPIGAGATYVVKEADEGAKVQVVATTSDPDNSSTALATSAATAPVIDAAPTIVAGTTTTKHIVAAPQDVAAPLTSLAASYLTAGHDLINGLGGSSGFGENDLPIGDDNSSGAIDIRPVFGAAGLNFFGHNYTSLYINNNGNLTFGSPSSQFTPSQITAGINNPIIAPFWADVDTRGVPGSATPGGHSTGANRVHYALDTINGVMTVTWDDVGYYLAHTNPLDAFQVQLISVGNGNFDIVFRYEDINWTTGDASGGRGGLGGQPARAGYSAGDTSLGHYFELPQSGNQAQMLALPSTAGNTGIPGVDVFEVRNGDVTSPNLMANGTILFSDADLSDTHGVGVLLSSAVRSAGGDIPAATQADLAHALTTSMTSPSGHDSTGTGSGAIGWAFSLPRANARFLAPDETLTIVYNVTIDDHHGGTVTQPVTVTITGAAHETDWNAAANGIWENDANWNHGVPSSSVAAVIAVSGTYTVSINSSTAQAHSLNVDNSHATVAVDAGHSLTTTGPLTVDAGTLSVFGGTIQAGSIDLESGATLAGFGTVSGPIANYGLIEAQVAHVLDSAHVLNTAVLDTAHVLDIRGNITGTGLLQMTNNTSLELEGSVASTQTLSFLGGATGKLVLDYSATFHGVISGLVDSHQEVDLKDFTFTNSTDIHTSASYSSESQHTTLVVSNASTLQSVTLTLAGDYTNQNQHTWHFMKESGGGSGTIFYDPPATDAGATSVSHSASSDLAATVTAALATQGGAPDQFTFQGDSHSGTVTDASTLTASGCNPSPTGAATLHTTSGSSSDHQPTATAPTDGSAHTSLASNVAATSQPATGDSSTNGAQPGTMTPTATASPAATGTNGADTFVFAANFGNTTVTNFHPATDVIQIDHTVFANFQALLTATHDDGHGNAVITADPHDTITVKNVTVAQLVQHQGDFHFT